MTSGDGGESELLDTNAIIALFKGDKSLKQRLLDRHVTLAAITLGELYYGVWCVQL